MAFSLQESLGNDPGLVSDILASFDTQLDEEKTDFKKALKEVAPEVRISAF